MDIIFKLGIAILQTSQELLLNLDMEGMLKVNKYSETCLMWLSKETLKQCHIRQMGALIQGKLIWNALQREIKINVT